MDSSDTIYFNGSVNFRLNKTIFLKDYPEWNNVKLYESLLTRFPFGPAIRISAFSSSVMAKLQEEAQWLIQNNLTSATAIPNFLNYVYVNGLESVTPDAVNIIE